jgi:hypothetical protein
VEVAAAREAEELLAVAAVALQEVVVVDPARAAARAAERRLRAVVDPVATLRAQEPARPVVQAARARIPAVVRRGPVVLGLRAAQARQGRARPIAQVERAEAALKAL